MPYENMNQADKITISRIVKVNHAGEYGAIRIYRAQIWVSKFLYPEIVAFLEETLEHEINHCALFRSAMPERNSRPCRIMALWGNGGFVLGFATALLGRQGVWLCTAAVEKTVHHHLEDQLFFLKDRDPALFSLIKDIQQEELSHLHHAEDHITTNSLWARVLTRSIALATNAVMWLSTWGDSSKMAKSLRKHNS
ncbi:ubiquinone biosynthesis protein UbiB [Kiloniella litopenaei]|uniref:Ubiquinone biosynthesis protein UbiB n=2 Tax=Kiloniella litopenaei TaxID=1549748 RepID=A0A0M2RAD3_9PROT|nr:ubiquinone biosynthesis protein UbiB [Kiloniella litopenaei]